jgi:hypothetical protein
MYRLLPIAFTCLLGLVAASSHAGTASDRFEIAGLRTGMTETEVVAALKAHDAGLQLQRTLGHFTYRDGVTTHRSPDYLSMIFAAPRDTVAHPERIRVMFGAPPGDARVVSVSRELGLRQPPTAAQIEQQLVQKYGPPLYRRAAGSGATFDLGMVWEEEARPNCWRMVPQDLNVPAVSGPSQGPIAEYILNGQRRGKLPRVDVAQCGRGLHAQVVGDPVRTIIVRMSDLGAWAASDLAASRWVEGLRQEAERARLAGGRVPKL